MENTEKIENIETTNENTSTITKICDCGCDDECIGCDCDCCY